MKFSQLLAGASRFLRDCRGGMGPVSASVILGAVGATAVAIDGNLVRQVRSELQATADASALAGAKALAVGSSVSGAAIALAEINMPVADHGHVLTAPNVDVGSWNASSNIFTPGAGGDAVRVKVERAAANGNPILLTLASVLGRTTADGSATAVAHLMEKPLCALALDPNGQGIRLEQNNDLFAANCTIWSNATHGESVAAIHSSAQFYTGSVRPCAAGQAFGGSADFSAFPHENCAQKDDPLLTQPLPAAGGCTYSNKIVVKPKDGATFHPGVYCNDIDIKPNAEGEGPGDNPPIEFMPGVYVFKKGMEFRINNNNEIRGSDVLFHFAESSSWVVESNVEAELKGRFAGPYAGMLVTQSRTSPGGIFEIRSNTDFDLEGVVYLPKSTLLIGADTHVSINSPWLAFIVKDFVQIANSDITLNIDYSLSSVPYPPLLQQMFTTLVR